MQERIEIAVPEEEIARNGEKRERLRRTHAFEPTDRVPVIINVNQWVGLAARRVSAGEYVRSSRDNLRQQILNYKWRLENIRDDQPINTESLTIGPDLGCLRGCEFEMDVIWPQDQPPKCAHPLSAVEQIDALEVPDPCGGLNVRKLAWWREMRRISSDFDVLLNGRPLELKIDLRNPGGPIPSAFALAGANLFLWMITDPERVHRLLEIVTRSHLRVARHFAELMGHPLEHPLPLGADTAEMVNPAMFREFVVPYYLQIWQSHEGRRSLHMCGRTNHLLHVLRDELQIGTFNGFGFCVERSLLGEVMAGRVRLIGGLSPMLVHAGPAGAIVTECLSYIETLGSRGGFILTTGGAAAPHTPADHFRALLEASKRAGAVMKS